MLFRSHQRTTICTRRERGSVRVRSRRRRSHHEPRAPTSPATQRLRATNPDRRSTSTSNRTQSPGSHAFDFVDFARLQLRRYHTPGSHAFDFADFARLRLRRDGTETALIALRSQLRNGWVLMNLTGFDEYFLVGFCFCVYLLRNGIIYLFGS